MQLGAFSVSLSVKDLEASKTFYEKLGFRKTGGDDTGYLIMVNDTTIIGLFHGMFEGNILTFNPGLSQDMSRPEIFTDLREIRASLVADGVEISTDTDPEGTGPAHIVVMDPDGNPVLIDQFFPKPGRDRNEAGEDQNPGSES